MDPTLAHGDHRLAGAHQEIDGAHPPLAVADQPMNNAHHRCRLNLE